MHGLVCRVVLTHCDATKKASTSDLRDKALTVSDTVRVLRRRQQSIPKSDLPKKQKSKKEVARRKNRAVSAAVELETPVTSSALPKRSTKNRSCQSDTNDSLFDPCDDQARKKAKFRSKKNGPIYKCSQCKYSTPYKKSLTVHEAKHDPSVRLHRCPTCRYIFVKESASSTHKCRAEKIHVCSRCDHKTVLKKQFKVHQIQHKELEMKKSLPIRKSQKKSSTMRKKRKMRKKNNLPCQECDYVTSYKKSLLVHRAKHDRGLKIHRCTVCRYVFLKESTLITHKCRPDRVLFCSRCDFKTSLKSQLKLHMEECSLSSSSSSSVQVVRQLEFNNPVDRLNETNVLDFVGENDVNVCEEVKIEIENIFLCTICDAVFEDEIAFSEHSDRHIVYWF